MQIAQGPYSQHYTFSITYECALSVACTIKLLWLYLRF